MNKRQNAEMEEWLKKEKKKPKRFLSKNAVLSAINKDLGYISKMDSEEYTFYRKHQELQSNEEAKQYIQVMLDKEFWTRIREDENNVNELADYLMGKTDKFKNKKLKELESLKNIWSVAHSIWLPCYYDNDKNKVLPLPLDEHLVDGSDTPYGIHSSKIKLTYCKSKSDIHEWNRLRNYIHTQDNKGNPGRGLKFIIEMPSTEENGYIDKSILGIIAISSDFRDLKPRDVYIGWSQEIRSKQSGGVMNRHTMIGSTIAPTQPFGFNYNGGKLIALLTLSDVVKNACEEKYNDVIVGMTTTNLYGLQAINKNSMYSNLSPYWKELGETEGTTPYKPSDDTIDIMYQYLRQYYPEDYWKLKEGKNEKGGIMTTDATNRAISKVYNKLKIDRSLITTGHKRGVYFAEYYENTKEYLRKEISENELIPRKDIKFDVESLFEFWRNTNPIKNPAVTAIDRIHSLKARGIKPTKTKLKYDYEEDNFEVFYSDLAFMDWNYAKEKYLRHVGNYQSKQEGNKK
jgi:hypothetical protein